MPHLSFSKKTLAIVTSTPFVNRDGLDAGVDEVGAVGGTPAAGVVGQPVSDGTTGTLVGAAMLAPTSARSMSFKMAGALELPLLELLSGLPLMLVRWATCVQQALRACCLGCPEHWNWDMARAVKTPGLLGLPNILHRQSCRLRQFGWKRYAYWDLHQLQPGDRPLSLSLYPSVAECRSPDHFHGWG